jgi:hypothetical protein
MFDKEIEYIADYLLANGIMVLPCKVGDVVYTNISGTTLHNSFMINHIDLLGFSNGLYSWTWHQLGKSVFLSIEEADKALAEREGKNNG